MSPIQLFDPASGSYTYLLCDPATREALIIDPVDSQLERDLATLERLGLRLRWTVETHAHDDHITSAARLVELTGAHSAAPAGCAVGTAAVQLHDGDTLAFGSQTLRVLHTPGHTAGSVCYLWQAVAPGLPAQLFTGDTLLIGDCGRTDLPSGDAGRLYDSITARLFTLPADSVVWPGHDYLGQTRSSIGVEQRTNPRLAGRSRENFIRLIEALQQTPAPPRRADALLANQRSGLRQDAGTALPPGQPVRPALGYAGDVSPCTAHAWMRAGRAVLVDVRTDAEREWVGFVPGAVAVAWKQWPGMAPNADFDDQIRAAAANGQPLVLWCRSGVRSVAAARRATELGLTAYNMLEGFEGDPDQQAQRGHLGGWRQAGLPWRQN